MQHLAPLSHIAVLIMRAENQARDMAAAVLERGGVPIEVPLLQMVPTTVQAARPLEHYAWIIFTSKNGVQFFVEGLKGQRIPSSVRLAAVGEKTKQALEDQGYSVRFMPQRFVAEAFAAEFIPLLAPKEHVLLPKGNLARDVIPKALQEHGVALDELVVYETKRNEAAKQLLIDVLQKQRVDVLTFTSPSTVTHFTELLEGTNWREWVKRCTIACIGPVTERAALACFSSVLVPDTYTIDGLLDRLEKHFANRTQ